MKMTKRFVKLLGLCLGAALVLHGGDALALTAAHKSTATGALQGDCSACHIPHKAAGAERLFPTAASFVNNYGFIGSMCSGYCHNGNVGRANALGTVFVNPGATDNTAGAHGMLRNAAGNAPANTQVGPTTLPYSDGTAYTDEVGS